MHNRVDIDPARLEPTLLPAPSGSPQPAGPAASAVPVRVQGAPEAEVLPPEPPPRAGPEAEVLSPGPPAPARPKATVVAPEPASPTGPEGEVLAPAITDPEVIEPEIVAPLETIEATLKRANREFQVRTAERERSPQRADGR